MDNSNNSNNNSANNNSSQVVDTCGQIKNFWKKIGFFTKLVLIVNLISYLVTNLILAYGYHEGKPYFDEISLCPAGVIDSFQYYRLLTSEISHGSPSHIMFNMVTFMLWGTELEKYYGTTFYASVNIALGLMSNFLNIGIQFFRAYYVPAKLFGYDMGGPKLLVMCGIGYSNILFGLMLLEAYMGDEKHHDCFGIKIRKILMPWIWLLLIQLCVPEASMVGHLAGILSALLLKHCGFSLFLPDKSWIEGFEEAHKGCIDRIDRWFTYYKATDNQQDFGYRFFICIFKSFIGCINRVTSKICGKAILPEDNRNQRRSQTNMSSRTTPEERRANALSALAMRQMPIVDEQRVQRD